MGQWDACTIVPPVDGMADFGVELVLAKIAALKNRDRPDDDQVWIENVKWVEHRFL